MKSIVDQASEILSKEEELTLADYKKFIKLQDMAKTEEEKSASLLLILFY